jgi:hypothetical protein
MTGDFIEVNGERIPKHEALALIKMLCNAAKQKAGEFHGMERSPKFRANWPNQNLYAESEWRNFMEAAREMYANRLADPLTPPADARKMHLAIVLHTMAEQAGENDNRLQLRPNTQQFVGDPFENKKIVNHFGKHSNTFLDLALGQSTARYH